MLIVADRSAASGPPAYRDLFAENFAWRLTMLGAAALGFLVTFLLLDHEIHLLENVMLPLLAILTAYLFLSSLNTWYAAKTTVKLGDRVPHVSAGAARHLRTVRALQSVAGFALG